MIATSHASRRHDLPLALTLGLAMAILGRPAAGLETGVLAAQAVNPCALLTVAEVQQALALTIKAGTIATVPLGSTTCKYEWGTGDNVQAGKSSLTVAVSDATKKFPGMNAAKITKAVLADKDATPIPDVGDAATFKSSAPIRGDATAYVKKKILEVTFESKDGRAKKDKVIALLKTAAERL